MIRLIKLTFINHERSLPMILDVLAKTAQEVGLSSEKLDRLVAVAEEVILRRLKNGFEERDYLTMELACDEIDFEFNLQDKGAPYWSVNQKIGAAVYSPKLQGKSFGEIRQMVDSIGTELLGTDGQKTFIRMHLDQPSFEKRAFSEAEPKDLNFKIIEVTTESEMLQAELCVWDEYRYSYPFEGFYQPKILKETIASGKIRSYLTVNDHGEVAGHYALTFSDDHPGMPELASVVVRRNFRGLGIFSRMMKHGVAEAKRLKVAALLIKPTLFHTATQHEATKLGFVPTAIAFDHIYEKVESEYNQGDRLSVACSVRLLAPVSKATLYPLPEWRPLIVEIYAALAKDYQFAEGAIEAETSRLRSDSDTLTQSGRILVDVIGHDFAEEIREIDRDFTSQKIEAWELFLPLEDPGCPAAARGLKKLGYFFTGVIPGGENGDLVLLQKVITGLPSGANIVTEKPYTELFAAVTQLIEERD